MPSLKRNKNAKQTATEIKSKLKVLRKQTLDDVSQKMFQAKEANNGKLPHRFVTSQIDETKSSCPWMNRDVVNHHFKRWSKKQHDDILQCTATVLVQPISVSCNN